MEKNAVVKFNIRGGKTAIVSEIDYEKIKKYKWGWMNRGVCCFSNKQTILLHNLIAPYKRVSFLNGDKLDCRRENLINWEKTCKGKISKIGNVSLDSKKNRYCIHRRIVYNGQRYSWATSVGYKKIKTKEEALKISRKIAASIFSMDKQQFFNFIMHRKSRKKMNTNQIISDWDCFSGKNFSMEYVYQSSMKFRE